MKRIVKMFTVVIALLVVLPVFGEKIFWKGDWNFLSGSQDLFMSIIGNVNEEAETLTLEFPCDLGDVIVSITDASGNVVYQESIQTNVTPSVNISLVGLDVDGGMVSITDGQILVYSLINL